MFSGIGDNLEKVQQELGGGGNRGVSLARFAAREERCTLLRRVVVAKEPGRRWFGGRICLGNACGA